MSYRTESLLRVGIATVGFLSAFVAPWWVPMLAIILLAFRFRAWEALLIGLLVDLLWLPTGSPLAQVPFFTIVSIAIVWGFEPLRSQFLIRE